MRLKFEPIYKNVTIQHINHNTIGTLQLLQEIFIMQAEMLCLLEKI